MLLQEKGAATTLSIASGHSVNSSTSFQTSQVKKCWGNISQKLTIIFSSPSNSFSSSVDFSAYSSIFIAALWRTVVMSAGKKENNIQT